jgi:hypothetical protein
MVSLVDLENPSLIYEGRIFWDMVRPGVRLAVLGDKGCMTSVLKKVVELARGQYYLQTRNSRYLLTAGRIATPEEIGAIPTVVGA